MAKGFGSAVESMPKLQAWSKCRMGESRRAQTKTSPAHGDGMSIQGNTEQSLCASCCSFQPSISSLPSPPCSRGSHLHRYPRATPTTRYTLTTIVHCLTLLHASALGSEPGKPEGHVADPGDSKSAPPRVFWLSTLLRLVVEAGKHSLVPRLGLGRAMLGFI